MENQTNVRLRHAALYPTKTTTGISLWVTDGRFLRAIAVGSVPTETLHPHLELFSPDIIILESSRTNRTPVAQIKIPAPRSLRFAHPEWSEHSLRVLQGLPRKLHSTVQNAYRIGFNEVVRRPARTLATHHADPLTDEWLNYWGPPKVKNAPS